MERSIIHLNVADFAVAVERVADFTLRKRPVIVAPERAARAVVHDMSDEAYRAGVRKRMPLCRAQRLCRDALVVTPRPNIYERAMGELLRRALPYSPLVEESGEGHLFIDATGTGRLHGPAPDVAWRLRKSVRKDLGLDPIWSVAANKLIAKAATRVVKPNGERVVEAGEEERFLQPLPVGLLPGVEKEDLLLLRELNLSRVGELALLGPSHLRVLFGSRATVLHRAARGFDPSPVLPFGEKPPAASAEHVFPDDTNDAAVVEGALYRLVERAASDLRARGLAAQRVGLYLEYSDGVRIARQRPARIATANDFRLFRLAKETLSLAWRRRVRVRSLRLVLDRLTYPPPQLELFPEADEKTDREERLVAALDRVRRRFGEEAISTGRVFHSADPQAAVVQATPLIIHNS